MKVCEKCKKEYNNTGNRQKFCPECKPTEKQKAKKEPAKKPVKTDTTQSVAPPSDPEYIILNILPYAHIYPRLAAESVKDFRTPELQAIYYLDMMLSEPEKKKPTKKKDQLDDL